ncbi:MAG: hypothetical protein ACQEW9_03760 [Bacteroidota bacterium]
MIFDEIERKVLGEIWMDINSSDFPLKVDLQVWKDIKNEKLKEHIRRVGKVFYYNLVRKPRLSLFRESVAY